MSYRLYISGVTGKMGQAVLDCLEHPFDVCEVLSQANIVIDFSHPDATLKLLEDCHCPVVIGTTGFSESQKNQILNFSKKYPTLFSSNMSYGMNLLFSIVQKLPPSAFSGSKVFLEEEHHIHKKDSPSGTAKTLVALVSEKNSAVEVNSIRAGEIVGNHSLKVIWEKESLTFAHQAFDRSVFAMGALKAATFLMKQTEAKLYSFQDVVEEVL